MRFTFNDGEVMLIDEEVFLLKRMFASRQTFASREGIRTRERGAKSLSISIWMLVTAGAYAAIL
jgi:hypothetical protein